MSLLDHLREGPVRSDDWARVGSSLHSLRQRIYFLREKGVQIATVPIPHSGTPPKVEYRLIEGPCPCCGRGA